MYITIRGSASDNKPVIKGRYPLIMASSGVVIENAPPTGEITINLEDIETAHNLWLKRVAADKKQGQYEESCISINSCRKSSCNHHVCANTDCNVSERKPAILYIAIPY